MFLSELSPVCREFLQQPVAFSGGFFSGLLKLKLNEEPLAGWLTKQGYTKDSNDDDDNRPKTISID
ncbi:MAG: hypothetical protein QNJ32_02515 [Xenococcaceae cyanobacterium MO_167.B27]|nr:hypothetical protein [Xenococcaceae cyanobacterium MO_167.B27]